MASDSQGKSKSSDPKAPITIKKYANRRLYNTATSSYVTLDITRSVLTQIIVEEEAKGQNLLPINFLRQLISFYGHSMQWMVPSYLEQMMNALAQNQDRLRQSMQDAFGGMFPFGSLEAMGKQNMAAIEQAMKLFTPFSMEGNGPGEKSENPDGNDTPSQGKRSDNQDEESLEELKVQIDQLRRQLDALSRTKEK